VYRAAALLPHINFVITGRPRPTTVQRLGAAPFNLELTGYLSSAQYEDALSTADVVLALTTREETMQRAGYEAMQRHLPLVASSTGVLKHYFAGGTVFTENESAALATAVEAAVEDFSRLAAEMKLLHEVKQAEYREQLEQLRSVIA
jgi:glycosyltransferase involved in cell wall biosynthesis